MCVCPGTTTFTDQHVKARTHLCMAIMTYMARFGLPIVAVSGLQTCDSCRFGRSLALHHHVCSGSLFEGSLTLLSPGRRSWGRVLRARAYLPTRNLSDPNVPLDMETLFPVDVVERPWNWPVGAAGWEAHTATVTPATSCPQPQEGRLQCNGPGIEVQLSVSKGRLQRHLMDDICSMRNARASSINHAQIFQMEISKQLSMASLEHVLLPR